MYTFFYSLTQALFRGQWSEIQEPFANMCLITMIQKISNWLMNLFGGNFSELQEFDWTANVTVQAGWQATLTPINYIYALVALIIMLSIILSVIGIVKKVFAIFFAGVR